MTDEAKPLTDEEIAIARAALSDGIHPAETHPTRRWLATVDDLRRQLEETRWAWSKDTFRWAVYVSDVQTERGAARRNADTNAAVVDAARVVVRDVATLLANMEEGDPGGRAEVVVAVNALGAALDADPPTDAVVYEQGRCDCDPTETTGGTVHGYNCRSFTLVPARKAGGCGHGDPGEVCDGCMMKLVDRKAGG